MSKQYELKDYLEVQSSIAPSYNFDGSKIAFLNNASGTHQLCIVSTNGGAPEQITSYDERISFAVFSPIKDEIIFGKDVGGDEKTQFYIYSLERKEISNITNDPSVRYNFGQFSRDGKYISFSNNARNGKDFDIYIMDLATRETECVYQRGGWFCPIGFSPLNNYLVVSKQHSNVNHDLHLITLSTKSSEPIALHTSDAVFGMALWTPDESAFYITTNLDREFSGLSIYNIKEKTITSVLAPEWDVERSRISQDGSKVALLINEDGYNVLRVFNTRNFQEIPMLAIPKNSTAYSVVFSKDANFLALALGGSTKATDIWNYSFENDTCNQITFSAQAVPSEALVEPTLIRYSSFDGLTIPAFMYIPKDASKDKKVPVIVNIHGGPEGQYTPDLALLMQYFVSRGYAVIGPNVRGSAGYGKKYMALDDVEKRLDSVRDLAMLHEYIKTVPELDSEKVVLCGGSYGGYMTLAGMAFYPDLWIAGIDIVGIANFITFLENTAPYRRAVREAEYGSLETDRELLYAISPINHVEKITAPLFVIHGVNDPRVPLSEAEQIVSKLNALGRKTELLVYPDEGHGLSKLKNRLDAYSKILMFLEKLLK